MNVIYDFFFLFHIVCDVSMFLNLFHLSYLNLFLIRSSKANILEILKFKNMNKECVTSDKKKK